ncbi:MAG TPA: helix-turn-helix transcriptional regulator [Polyangiaceae bacterium]|nr:helix-turn-helix transcriptional regulator [Polyangiaceae bacterium]
MHRTGIGDRFSEAARLLWEEMTQRSWDQSQLAEYLGTSSGTVNRWLYGERRATGDWPFVIQDKLGIDARLWGVNAKKPFEPPAARA